MKPAATVAPHEVTWTAIRAQGAGGQNVNKVSNAVHLRFEVRGSSLPDDIKHRLLALRDTRITRDGVVVIKAQAHRSLEMNRADAMARLQALVDSVADLPRVRRATRPTRGSQLRRLDSKRLHSQVKAGRRAMD
ncbi:alternative ribosome rescue aminoacyl-tRNA hydrolase ArfB [Aquincola sp. MAHUQ-54]|uniref:Alternative ribosome rescue aminoacyl-tRNA hydrolase ArfB n=1 Tax=Aquincola agrisoli TaxID=3119538 RepID=A0AAW9QP20_9BURK